MNKNLLVNFSVDKENKKIKVEREFAAPLESVWAAWTQHELLDQWWAPKPYQTRTKSQDFREGGTWLYYMEGPEGAVHWCKADYQKIEPLKSYTGLDAFCDENGNINEDFPRTTWSVSFKEHGESTIVYIENTFTDLADLEKIIEMGFKEGFLSAMTNLDAIFAS